jgi:acyl-CoA dehydrogenase
VADAGILEDRVIRPTLTGRAITCLAVTEPDGGSDVGGLRTTAEPIDSDGEITAPAAATHWRLNGSKAYITSGARADFAVVAARAFGPGAAGVALFVVPTDTPGFSVTARMKKMGWHCSDTAELAFTDVVVPAWALLTPGPGEGFGSLARHFAVERIRLRLRPPAAELTLDWARQRGTFGRPLIAKWFATIWWRCRLTDVARSYTPGAVAAGALLVARWPNTGAACDWVVDKAVQLHGGYGFLRDAEVEMHYRRPGARYRRRRRK